MSRKLAVKRLIIFVFFSYALVWVVNGIAVLSGVKYEDQVNQMILMYSMFCPTIAMILTRLITGEKLVNTGFGISLKGKKKYYLLAILIPVIYSELGWALYYLVDKASFDASMPLVSAAGMSKDTLFLFPLNAVISSLIFSAAAMGEEGGWRGYMYPLLSKLFGDKWACIIGGIIWSVWHFPSLIQGHNFGTDYPGYPYVGCIVFTAFCIGVGAIMWYLTKKSKSIWPAAFLHAVNNAYISGAFMTFFMTENGNTLYTGNPAIGLGIIMLPSIIIGMILFFFLKDKKSLEK